MTSKSVLKQECPLAFVVLSWLLYLGAIPVLVIWRQWLLLPVWIILAPALMFVYIKSFPSIAPFMGYGSVADRPAATAPGPVQVTLYAALGCPFCPIVKRRLVALEPEIGFTLREVDVTARPDLLTRKGIWSVPVVEVAGRRLVGHATSAELADLILGRDRSGARKPTEGPEVDLPFGITNPTPTSIQLRLEREAQGQKATPD